MKEGTRLLDFYEGKGRDHRGRTLSDVHQFSVDVLEYEHDFIQWLFPLRTASPVNPEAPILAAHDIESFRASDTLKLRLRESFVVMLGFYGLLMKERDGSIVIERADTFPARAQNWLTPGNHNFLRITRILKSMAVLGEERLARAFLECLETIFDDYRDVIGDRTWRFWADAVNEPR